MSGALHHSVLHLLSALSEAVGQAVVLGEEGECGLEFEGQVDVVVALASPAQVLSIRSPLTAAGQSLGAALLLDALSLNYTSMPPGYAIALDAPSRQLVLISLVDAEATSRDDFLRLVAGFLELVPDLRERCGAAPDVQPTEAIGKGVLA